MLGVRSDDYYAPLRDVVAEVRAADPEAAEDPIESEMRAYEAGGREFWGYTVFVARKPV